MSTFDGRIAEIPDISVDRFDGDNVNSSIYFLSHCHTDHMQGLSDWDFHQSLIHRPNVFLYASSVSVIILKNLYPHIESKLKELPMQDSVLIKFPYRRDTFLTVTLLPAGHCPGSVMFLFETDKIILYTGDYRVRASDLKKYSAFYSMGELKKIDKLYLDTTFFKLSFKKLPLRQESTEIICNVIREWIEQSEKHIIQIIPSARYGFEFLFIEIAKMLGMPIHVSLEAYMFYKHIPEMDKAVITSRRATQIHAGCGHGLKDICDKDNSLTRIVQPSVLWWEGNDFSKGITTKTETGKFRVCYSSHASFEEITEFLLFLKPAEVEPCVVPANKKEKEAMMTLLQQTILVYKDMSVQEVKLFDIHRESVDGLSTIPKSTMKTPEKGNCSFPDDLLSSPPTNFKRRRLWLNGAQKEQD